MAENTPPNPNGNSSDDVAQRLTQCFARVFHDLSQDELTRASMASVAAWDSVATITLIDLIQDEFGVALDEDEEALGQLTSFELILDYLREQAR
ncbi:MAG: hypothetical protein AAGC55_02115 [Myxococcota bacterium]